MAVTVQTLLKEKSADLQLEAIGGLQSLNREITGAEINRPGLAMAGFLENFRWERVQVIGRGEHAYLSKVILKHSSETLKQFLNFKIPCVVFSHNMKPQDEFIQLSNQYQVPVLVSGLETAVLVAELSTYLEEKVSPTITLHGDLVDVYGLGVFISGDSGIGKSECALELMKRGHMFVSDDLVQVQHRAGGILIGKPANEMMKHHMEVRGLGIIDIKQLFGVSVILDFTRIELVVHLEMWDATKEYDRVGLEEHSLEVLGIRLPRIIIPVRPGRNLAVLIEVAALYQRLKARGINSAQEMEKNLVQFLTKQSLRGDSAFGAPEAPRPHKETHSRPPYRRR